MQAQVTYIGHSGFLAELETVDLLFDCVADEIASTDLDYSTGKMPERNSKKPLLVFVSHSHRDHYSYHIWKLREKYENVWYILAKEVPFSSGIRKRLGISAKDEERILRVAAEREYFLSLKEEQESSGNSTEIKIETLRSTDTGVAYFVTIDGRTVFHAGDLHDWFWKEEGDRYCNEMHAAFLKQLKSIEGRNCDIAFLLLDPRLGEQAYMGIDEYLTAMKVKYCFPMHFWKQYSIMPAYHRHLQEHPEIACEKFIEIEMENQTFPIFSSCSY